MPKIVKIWPFRLDFAVGWFSSNYFFGKLKPNNKIAKVICSTGSGSL